MGERGGGSIRERRPGVWEVRFSVQGTQQSRTVHGSEKDAQKALRRALVEIDDGVIQPRRKTLEPEKEDHTLKAAVERWLALAGPDFSPGTIRTYRMYLRRYIYPALGARPVNELRTTELDDLYIAMRNKGLHPKSIRQAHAIIGRALKMARRWGWLETDPAALVTLPRMPRSEVIAPSPEIVWRFVTEAPNPELSALFLLTAMTGARRGEVCALRWPDIDFKTDTLTIARALVELEGGGWLEKDTKTHAIRTIKLPEAVVRNLLVHRSRMVARARAAETELAPDAFVFTFSFTGDRPWMPDYATAQFSALRDRLGLPRALHFHSLRHFSASRLLAAGVDVRTVSGRHGWADATMPLNRYGHFIPAADERAADVMGELLSPDAKKPPGLPAAAEPEDQADGVRSELADELGAETGEADEVGGAD